MLTDYDPVRLILAGSSVALTALVIGRGLFGPRPVRALIGGAALAVGLWWIYSLTFPASVRSRGSGEGVTLAVSYIAMVFGMMAQYVYAKVDKGDTTLTFEWLPFLMPILASPIVFIPLVSIAGEVSVTGEFFTRAKLMVYLVAFQNGFFWKHFLEQRRPASSAAKPPSQPVLQI